MYEDLYTVSGSKSGLSQYDRWFADAEGIWTIDMFEPIYLNGEYFGVLDIGMPESGVKEVVSSVLRQQILTSLISFMLIALLIYFVVGVIVRKIHKLSAVIEKIGNLDFTPDPSMDALLDGKDEIGQMANALKRMNVSIASVLQKVNLTSGEIFSASNELKAVSNASFEATHDITNAVDEMAKATEEQATDTEKGAHYVSDLSKDIEDVLMSTREIVKMTKTVESFSVKGMTTLSTLGEWSEKNKSSSLAVSRIVKDVDTSVDEISEIINAITGIATQTNLLALNASIESARAGEAGRGFAVVADEIRKLAEQTSEATDFIRKKIGGIQSISGEAVEEINNTLFVVEENAKVALETRSIFDQIKDQIEKTSGVADQVTVKSEAMRDRKDQIVNAIDNISASAEETSASTEEVSASAQEQLSRMEAIAHSAEGLSEIASVLQSELVKFKL